MTEVGTHQWWEHYKTTVNADPEMSVRGHDKFSENFRIEIGDTDWLVEVDGGRVESIVPEPGLDHEWAFGVTGSEQAWEEFLQETPPAFNHELIASHYRGAVAGEDDRLQITGDNKRVFQNLRAFQRALDLLRHSHNNGGA
ncbi:hypothetical protein [Salarchaeum sp. JOR-1]|uniref:hypothetical protein n=1 Tax=Salarchaeum sp. JOR-1 TaxID=2599399 RepID=UPI001198C540|nr:hypothetical protein [Salarchaeum sp. JOR-1]QDX39459.1 hypothetical protein FQU85_00670 [Salarchaeum sp. JOR-1]